MKVAYGIELQVLATTVPPSCVLGISTTFDRPVRLSTTTGKITALRPITVHYRHSTICNTSITYYLKIRHQLTRLLYRSSKMNSNKTWMWAIAILLLMKPARSADQIGTKHNFGHFWSPEELVHGYVWLLRCNFLLAFYSRLMWRLHISEILSAKSVGVKGVKNTSDISAMQLKMIMHNGNFPGKLESSIYLLPLTLQDKSLGISAQQFLPWSENFSFLGLLAYIVHSSLLIWAIYI